MITFPDQDALDRYVRAHLIAAAEAHVESSRVGIISATNGLSPKASQLLRQLIAVNNATLLAAARSLPLPKVPR